MLQLENWSWIIEISLVLLNLKNSAVKINPNIVFVLTQEKGAKEQ